MSTQHEKMVLTGGRFSVHSINAALELSGVQNPKLVIDTSPKAGPKQRSASRKSQTKWFADFPELPKPTFLSLETPNRSLEKAKDLINETDVMVVTGGGMVHGLRRWNELGVAELIRDRVQSGDMVIHGASAGTMLWFDKGYSDSHATDKMRGDWQYVGADGMGVIPGWVMAHHDESDEFGREKSLVFRQTLAEHDGEWERALGIETDSALICHRGMMRVMDVRKDNKTSHETYIYTPNPGSMPAFEPLSNHADSSGWVSLGDINEIRRRG